MKTSFSNGDRRGAPSREPGRFPCLTTERLALRELLPRDARDLFAFRRDPEVQRYNGGSLGRLDQASGLIAQMAAGYREGTMVEWAVTLRGGDDAVIGMFGYANWSHACRRAEIGYDLHRDFWKRGLAEEALRAIVAFGFGEMDLNRIQAVTWAENAASVRTLERLGFRREGVAREEYWLDGTFHDEALYGLLRREYHPAP